MSYPLPFTWSRCVQKHARSGWQGVDLATNFVCCCYRERDQARIRLPEETGHLLGLILSSDELVLM